MVRLIWYNIFAYLFHYRLPWNDALGGRNNRGVVRYFVEWFDQLCQVAWVTLNRRRITICQSWGNVANKYQLYP